MEKRTGKKPREAIGWERQRQEDYGQREGGEERQERSMFYSQRYNLLQLNGIFTKFASICLQKRKKEKKKSNRVRRDLQYSDGQLSHLCWLYPHHAHAHAHSDKQCSIASVGGPLC